MGDIIPLEGERPVKAVGAVLEKPEPKSDIHTNFFGIPLDIIRTVMFLKFIGTPEARVYFLLYSYIRRGQSGDYGNVLYQKFYKGQGKLVSRWNQDKIAEMLGLKNRASVSKYTKRLEKHWKFIKIHKIVSHKDTMNVYEIGYLKKEPGSDKKVECIHMFERIAENGVHIYDKVNKEREETNNKIEEWLSQPMFV